MGPVWQLEGLADQVLAPLPIWFAVFTVHLAMIPITGTEINPARSFGDAVIYNNDKAWDDQVYSIMCVSCVCFYIYIHIFDIGDKFKV